MVSYYTENSRGWKQPDARYSRSRTGGGQWADKSVPQRWQIHYQEIQRMGLSSRPEARAFSLAHWTMPLAASTWQTDAPAAAQATVAPPV